MASTQRPIRQLEAFERIHLKSGESKIVNFTLTARQLSMINKNSERIIEPGEFEISIGGEQPGFKGDNNSGSTEVILGKFVVKGKKKFSDL